MYCAEKAQQDAVRTKERPGAIEMVRVAAEVVGEWVSEWVSE